MLKWFGGSCLVIQMSTEGHVLFRCILQALKGELVIGVHFPVLLDSTLLLAQMLLIYPATL